MRKIILIVGLLISSLQAEELPIALTQAIIDGRPSLVREFLNEENLPINMPMGTRAEAPLHFAVRAYIREAEEAYLFRDGLADAMNGAAWMTAIPVGTMCLSPLCSLLESMNQYSENRDFEEIGYGCLVGLAGAEVCYGLYNILKGSSKSFFMTPYSSFKLYKRKKIIELLLEYPTIELLVVNSKDKSPLDLLHSAILKHAGNIRMFNMLKSVEFMLLEKQRNTLVKNLGSMGRSKP